MFQWVLDALSEWAPESGPRSARHLYMTLSSAVANYYTWGPVMSEMWGDDPLIESQVRERQEHIHWLFDVLLDALGTEGALGD